MRAVIYTRVSQDRSGRARSVEQQEAECRALCADEGWTVERVFTDNDRSASRFATKDRPEFAELIKYLRAGRADVLVLWEASRATRDLRTFLDLRDTLRAAGTLLSYSGATYDLSKAGDVSRASQDAVQSEYESARTSERVKRSMRAAALRGRPAGSSTPFGYRRVYDSQSGELVSVEVVPELAGVVREAAQRVMSGDSLYAIARDLQARGVPTVKGSPWHSNTLRHMLLNPAYYGKRTYRGEIISDAMWEPIYTEELGLALRLKLQDPARRTVPMDKPGQMKYLLSSIAVCGVCENVLKSASNRGIPSYTCKTNWCVSRSIEPVDALVRAVTIERLRRADALEALMSTDSEDAVNEAVKHVGELRDRLEAFYREAEIGTLSATALARMEASLLPQIEQAQRAATPPSVPTVAIDVAGQGYEAVAAAWDNSWNLHVRRSVVSALWDIRINKSYRGSKRFDPTKIQIAQKP